MVTYRLNDEALEYKVDSGQWTACTCPFLTSAVCTLACPLLSGGQKDGSGGTRAQLYCGNGREIVLTV